MNASRRLHILFISSWYPNRFDPTLGIFHRFFAEAAARNHDVSAFQVCADDSVTGDLGLTENNEGGIYTIDVYYRKVQHRIPFISALQKRKRFLHAYERAMELLLSKKTKPDLIQLNVVFPAGVAALHLAKKYSIPYIITENWTGYLPEDGSYRGMQKIYFTKKIVGAAKEVITVSAHLKKHMLLHGLKNDYTIIPNVVDTERFRPGTKKDNGETVFLHISTLDDAQKNISGMMRAFAAFHEKNKNSKLVFVGEGSDRQKMEALAKAMKLHGESVFFKGMLLKDDIVKEVNDSDALVLFSNYENLPLVIIETFSCGKPVITTPVGGIPEFINEKLGVVVQPENEKQLQDAFSFMHANKEKFDPAYIRDFAVKNFGTDRVAQQFDEVYRRVIGANK